MSTFTNVLLATAALSSVVSGHLILTSPTPFKFQNSDSARSPLAADGSDFPCKKVNNQPLQSAGSNSVAVGQQYTLTWDNYVTHGGGSCQLSVTRDANPTKQSVFKVIKTWQGGCPIASDGNNPANPLPYEIPPEVQNGDAVLAWTWIPRHSAAPEYYMNCAPITVSGGATDDSAFNQLPDLFVANIGSSCKVVNDPKNIRIPNPGKYVVTGGESYGFTEATGCTGYDGGASENPAPAPPSSAAPAPPPAATSPSSETTKDFGRNRGFDAGATTVPDSDAVAAPTASPAPAPAPPATGNAPAPPAAGDANRTCPVDGAIVCGSETQFALCNFGKVDVWQQTAAGTVCVNGAIQVSGAYAARNKRGAAKLKRHAAMHRHHHHARSMPSA